MVGSQDKRTKTGRLITTLEKNKGVGWRYESGDICSEEGRAEGDLCEPRRPEPEMVSLSERPGHCSDKQGFFRAWDKTLGEI